MHTEVFTKFCMHVPVCCTHVSAKFTLDWNFVECSPLAMENHLLQSEQAGVFQFTTVPFSTF